MSCARCWPRLRCRAGARRCTSPDVATCSWCLTAVLAIVGHLVERTRLRAPVAACRRRCCSSAWPSRACSSGAPLPAAQIDTAARAFLGRPQAAAFSFTNPGPRPLALEYAPATPAGFAPLAGVRRVVAAARGTVARCGDPAAGAARAAALADAAGARAADRFALAWWATTLRPRRELVVAPDALRARGGAARPGAAARARAASPAPAPELHQLRDYAPGDPLARIDWKATARTGALVTREYSEDQHLDVLVAIDAGRLSRRALRRARSLRPVQ